MTNLQMRLDGIVSREVENSVILLDTESNRIHHLNDTARYIWRLCNGVNSTAEIAASLARDFDIEKEIATRDVVEIMDKFRAVNLVVEA